MLDEMGAAVIRQFQPTTLDEYLDQKYAQAADRSMARDALDADLVDGGGGNFDGAGTGGQD